MQISELNTLTEEQDKHIAELENAWKSIKNDNNCPDVMCDDCNKDCELKKIMGETNERSNLR